MLRKFGFAALALFAGAIMFESAYEFTAFERVNSYVLRQHDAVDRLGDGAPFEARAVVRLSKLPNDLLGGFVRQAKAQGVPQQTINRGQFLNHQSFACTSRPSVTNATLTSGSCDFRGQITVPTAATVTITFGTAYAAAPICSLARSDGTSTTGPAYTVSTTALTITSVTFGAASIYNWICLGVMP